MKAEKMRIGGARVLGPHQAVVCAGFQWYRCEDCRREGLFNTLADDRSCTLPVFRKDTQKPEEPHPVL